MTIETWEDRSAKAGAGEQGFPYHMQAEIDELRAENEAVRRANLDCVDHFNQMREELAMLQQQEPVAWRWVWKSKPWDIEGWCYTHTFPNHPELQEIEALYLKAAAQEVAK